jgi:hypothetical protein
MANDSPVASWLDVWEHTAASPPWARADVLSRCLEPGADAPTLGARDARLLDLRALLFGAKLRSTATCPACHERCEWDCGIDTLRVAAPCTPPASLEVAAEGWSIRARPVTPADLAAISNYADEPAALRALLRRCVLAATRDGAAADPADLPDACVQQLSGALAAVDPQAATSVALVCPACAHHWSADFDIGAYLWTELDAWAQRTLADVHELASRYGWSEPEVLALSPARRARYIAMAGS